MVRLPDDDWTTKRGVERGQDNRQIGRGIGVGHAAADGAAVAHLHVADYRRGFGQAGNMFTHEIG